MYKRLMSLHNTEHSAFIFGPRGTGKTSWLKENYGEALYFDLLDDDTFTELSARPTRLSNITDLKLFGQDYPEAKLYLLYGGNEAYYENKIHVLPLVDAFKTLSQLLAGTN